MRKRGWLLSARILIFLSLPIAIEAGPGRRLQQEESSLTEPEESQESDAQPQDKDLLWKRSISTTDGRGELIVVIFKNAEGGLYEPLSFEVKSSCQTSPQNPHSSVTVPTRSAAQLWNIPSLFAARICSFDGSSFKIDSHQNQISMMISNSDHKDLDEQIRKGVAQPKAKCHKQRTRLEVEISRFCKGKSVSH